MIPPNLFQQTEKEKKEKKKKTHVTQTN